MARLLTVKQAAEFLGVSESTLRRWADEGRVPHRRMPGSRYRRFEREDIERFREAWRPEEPPDADEQAGAEAGDRGVHRATERPGDGEGRGG